MPDSYIRPAPVTRIVSPRWRPLARILWMQSPLSCRHLLPFTLAACFFALTFAPRSNAQISTEVVCKNGDGDFQADFSTGVSVDIGPARNGKMATRSCDAELRWNRQSLRVASGAFAIDLDAFGVDLGIGVPVATFQIKKSAGECCMSYEIYSLKQPAALRRTITGSDFFSAADSDLDGLIEIWTHDAAAVDGFEGLALDQFGSLPVVVLRFVGGKLTDVSSEFRSEFDRHIAEIRSRLTSQDLRDFKSTDGKLPPPIPLTVEGLRRRDDLRAIKAKILEIVWGYLYSGREDEAWNTLADLWPASDADRIRTAILAMRGRGIRTQVEATSTSIAHHPSGRIYDAITKPEKGKTEADPPQPILIWRPRPADQSPQNRAPQNRADSELVMELIVDSAGKVRSAQLVKGSWSDDALKSAVAGWKFIPAFRNGRPVAARVGITAALKQ